MEFNDPASITIELGKVPSLWREMHFKFQMNKDKPSKVEILTLDTQDRRKSVMFQTMGEDGVKNLRDMCDKALAYFERAKQGPDRPRDGTTRSAGSLEA